MKTVFKRYELKYLIKNSQKEELLKIIEKHMQADEYGKYSIVNLYYDTEDFLLIRRSIEKPVYKEKLRARSYGRASQDSTVFLELKKKYQRIVYKRRITLTELELENYFKNEQQLQNSQILNEIDYFKESYENIEPRVVISYDRQAFFGVQNTDLRLTLDENILWRDENLSLCSTVYGREILPEGFCLMEVKVENAIPLWLVEFLTKNKIYKTSFSKYGNAYLQMMKREKEKNYV